MNVWQMALGVAPIFATTLLEALSVTALKVIFLLKTRHVQILMNAFLINMKEDALMIVKTLLVALYVPVPKDMF
jgi:hypothetical protein